MYRVDVPLHPNASSSSKGDPYFFLEHIRELVARSSVFLYSLALSSFSSGIDLLGRTDLEQLIHRCQKFVCEIFKYASRISE